MAGFHHANSANVCSSDGAGSGQHADLGDFPGDGSRIWYVGCNVGAPYGSKGTWVPFGCMSASCYSSFFVVAAAAAVIFIVVIVGVVVGGCVVVVVVGCIYVCDSDGRHGRSALFPFSLLLYFYFLKKR